MRDVNDVGTPQGTVGTSLASQGFVTPTGQPSILPQRPSIVGVENVIFNNFIIGSTITGLNQTDNTFEYRDSFSHIVGAHTLMFGGELMFSQVNANADVQSNGTFSFFGSETGVDFADFLIGVPSFYKQGDARPFYMRNHYGSLFVQDSWRIRPRLTLNYGLRWDVIMPWYEKYNQIQTLVPGEQLGGISGRANRFGFSGRSGSIAGARAQCAGTISHRGWVWHGRRAAIAAWRTGCSAIRTRPAFGLDSAGSSRPSKEFQPA